jgi:hypothetical protein
MKNEGMTELQREALEHMEKARQEGLSTPGQITRGRYPCVNICLVSCHGPPRWPPGGPCRVSATSFIYCKSAVGLT